MPPFPTRAISRQTFEQSAVLLQRNAVRIDTIQPAPVLEPDHRFGPFGVPGYRTRPKDPSGICSRMLAIPRRTGFCPPSGLRMTSTPRLALPRASDQQTGTPFNKGRVSLTLQKIVPANIADFRAAQPRAGLKEIPLEAWRRRYSLKRSGTDIRYRRPVRRR